MTGINNNEGITETADAAYKAIPPFSEWRSLAVDVERWDRISRMLDPFEQATKQQLEKAFEVVKRTAAVETGAIEDLYSADRGITFTVATEHLLWQEELNKLGENASAYFQSQLAAYDMVLDFATKREPIAEAWIRELHRQICESQKTYKVLTPQGMQDQELPLGQYKDAPNHVVRQDGRIHSYAPVADTASEIHKFVQEVGSKEFENSNPILQAAYAHYAFVAIHPFPDGNGRVARALASVFTYRSIRVPLLILVAHRDSYFRTLSDCDNNGNYQSFVDFIFDRSADAMLCVVESLRAAEYGNPESTLASLDKLYRTQSGYTYAELDEAAYRVLKLMNNEINKLCTATGAKYKTLNIVMAGGAMSHDPTKPNYRNALTNGPQAIELRITPAPPVGPNIQTVRRLVIEIPKDVDKNEEIVIRGLQKKMDFAFDAGDVLPTESPALYTRLRIWCEAFFAEALLSTMRDVEASLRQGGYRA